MGRASPERSGQTHGQLLPTWRVLIEDSLGAADVGATILVRAADGAQLKFEPCGATLAAGLVGIYVLAQSSSTGRPRMPGQPYYPIAVYALSDAGYVDVPQWDGAPFASEDISDIAAADNLRHAP